MGAAQHLITEFLGELNPQVTRITDALDDGRRYKVVHNWELLGVNGGWTKDAGAMTSVSGWLRGPATYRTHSSCPSELNYIVPLPKSLDL